MLDTKRKALLINLNENIYGTFAEIGAGQEVARNFFIAGAASGTIAKAISAYDMAFSDAIYGSLAKGERYVSRERVIKMLDHEYPLLGQRLSKEKYPARCFFAFANTVTTLNYQKTNQPHGWMGIRFQLGAQAACNQIICHVRLLDSDASLQQRVLGILGVNLVYAVYQLHAKPQEMIESLADNLSAGSVEIDMIEVTGPDFQGQDNRLLNLYLIAKDFCQAAIFDCEGQVYQPKDLLYKKHVLVVRPNENEKEKEKKPSLPQDAIIQKAKTKVCSNKNCDTKTLPVLVQLSLLKNNQGKNNEIENLQVILKRIKDLSALGYYVLISHYSRHHLLAAYLDQACPNSLAILLPLRNLQKIFTAEEFGAGYERSLLAYISDLFSREVKLYAFADSTQDASDTAKSLAEMSVSNTVRPLFQFLLDNQYIDEIQ